MTENRFTIPKGYRAIKNTVTDECAIFYDTEDGLMFLKWLNNLSDENEQLKQRNTNQYNQLTEIWEIIEEENWEKLIVMKKQLKEDEERLQKEWKCYE